MDTPVTGVPAAHISNTSVSVSVWPYVGRMQCLPPPEPGEADRGERGQWALAAAALLSLKNLEHDYWMGFSCPSSLPGTAPRACCTTPAAVDQTSATQRIFTFKVKTLHFVKWMNLKERKQFAVQIFQL